MGVATLPRQRSAASAFWAVLFSRGGLLGLAGGLLLVLLLLLLLRGLGQPHGARAADAGGEGQEEGGAAVAEDSLSASARPTAHHARAKSPSASRRRRAT